MIRIIVKTRFRGIALDAAIYHKLLPNSRIVVISELAEDDPEFKRHEHINLYIEHLYHIDRGDFPSRYNVMMVNQEVLTDWDVKYLSKVDKFLCKTQEGVCVMRKYVEHSLIRFTSFTTPCTSTINLTDRVKNRMVLHLGALHNIKNTPAVIDAWGKLGSKSNGWTLVAVGNTIDPHELGKLGKVSKVDRYDGLGLHDAYMVNNIIYIMGHQGEGVIQGLWDRARFCVAPSYNEGWSHTINYARCLGVVTVTLDAPPMNEIGRHGLLAPIESKPKSFKTVAGKIGKWFMPDIPAWVAKDLAGAMEQMFTMTDKEYFKRSRLQKTALQKDTRHFERVTKAVFWRLLRGVEDHRQKIDTIAAGRG